MGAYSKLLGLWSPLYRSFACEPTILHLPDFDQLSVANLVNLLLMEEPTTDSFVRFNIEQMELFECLNIKMSGLTRISRDVETKKVEVRKVKRVTRSSGTVPKNVAKPPEKEWTPPVQPDEPVNYMCALCDSKVISIEKHMENDHEEIMPIPITEIATFFSIIPVTKSVATFVDNEKVLNSSTRDSKTFRNSLALQKSDTGNVEVRRSFKYDEADSILMLV